MWVKCRKPQNDGKIYTTQIAEGKLLNYKNINGQVIIIILIKHFEEKTPYSLFLCIIIDLTWRSQMFSTNFATLLNNSQFILHSSFSPLTL